MLNGSHGNITTHYLLPLKPLKPNTKSTYSFIFSCNNTNKQTTRPFTCLCKNESQRLAWAKCMTPLNNLPTWLFRMHWDNTVKAQGPEKLRWRAGSHHSSHKYRHTLIYTHSTAAADVQQWDPATYLFVIFLACWLCISIVVVSGRPAAGIRLPVF